MSETLYYNLLFVVEFLEVCLLGQCLFGLLSKRRVLCSFVGFYVVFNVLSYFAGDFREILYAVCVLIALVCSLKSFRKFWLISLFYFAICIAEMMLSLVIASAFSIDKQSYSRISLGMFLLNLLPVPLVLVISYISWRERRQGDEKHDYKEYIWIFLIGLVGIAFYLFSIQQFYLLEGTATDMVWKFALGSLVSVFILMMTAVLLSRHRSKEKELYMALGYRNSLFDEQKKYYESLLQREEETKAFRHDLQNHLLCMRHLGEEGDFEGLKKYLDELALQSEKIKFQNLCGNATVNVLLREIQKQFPKVQCQWEGRIPDALRMSQMDLCTVFSNVLKNAFESADACEDKYVAVKAEFFNRAMVLRIKNSVKNLVVEERGRLKTHKKEAGHGYGVSNVKSVLEQYDGSYEYEVSGDCFTTEIFIPDILDGETEG